MPTLLLATRNAHKTGEVRAMLGADWTLQDLSAHPELPEVDETAPDFAGNAALKALSASQRLPGVWVLADDSGLEVDALGGAPGVISARYSGEGATDASNRAKLLKELQGVPPAQRGARFRCAMALARDAVLRAEFDGRVEGRILVEERGAGGFGYDCLFAPDGHERTFGELSAEVKNSMSHRARALAQAVEYLRAG